MNRALLFLLLSAVGFQSSQRARIEGIVVDDLTGKPIASAEINRRGSIPAIPTVGRVLTAVETPLDKTDSGGRFQLENLEAGTLAITVSKAGYRSASSSYTLGAGQRVMDARFRLLPLATISGRVLDSTGRPAARVSVIPLRYQTASDGRRQLVSNPGTATNDRGEFRLFDLLPDRYFISFSTTSSSQINRSMILPFGSADASGRSQSLYPGVQELGKATEIQARGGEETELRTTVLTSNRYGTIRVHAINPAIESAKEVQFGFALSTPLISLTNSGMSFSTNMSTPTGAFVRVESGGETQMEYWPTQPGLYEASVVWNNSNGQTESLIGVTEFDGTSTTLDMVMVRPEGKLSLRVVQENPDGTMTPVEKVSLAFGSFSTSRVAYYVDSPGSPSARSFRPGYLPFKVTDINGTAILADLSPGRYDINRLTLSTGPLPQDLYVSSARQGDRDVLTEGALVTNQENFVEIRLRAGGGRLQGVVRNNQGQPLAAAMVVLLPDGSLNDRKLDDVLKATSAKSDGSFELRGIPPGSYRAYAWAKIETNAHLDPEFVKAYQDRGHPLQIKENDQVSLDLTILAPPTPR